MSKEAIINELPEPFVMQMRNWVKTRSNVGVYKISPAYEGMPGNPTFGSRVLADFSEVSMLERAIDALRPREAMAVKLFWIYEGNDLTWLGRRLGCDYRAVERRVRKGHEFLRAEIAKREAAYERQLDRHAAA